MFRIGSDCWDSVVSSGGNEMISSSETRSATVIYLYRVGIVESTISTLAICIICIIVIIIAIS